MKQQSKKPPRKKVLFFSGLLLVIITTIALTLAYMSDRRSVTNTFSLGEVEIAVTEKQWDIDGGSPRQITPGMVVNKDPAILNTGSVPCYVRATIAISDAELGQNQTIGDFIQLGNLHPNWRLALGHSWGDTNVTVYYASELHVAEETEPIFTHFTLNAHNTSNQAILEGLNNRFQILVTAEAVQSRAEGYEITSPEQAFALLMP